MCFQTGVTRRGCFADLTLTIRYLPQGSQGRKHLVKNRREAMMSLMHFWGVGFPCLGWLLFKISERM
jgi:uncharacterized protein with PQ loop repeat